MVKTGQSWYRLENRADAADLWLYDEIGEWGTTAKDFLSELKGIRSGALNVHLNSPGGEVFAGIAIYNALRSWAGQVNVAVDGLAASIASVIAMAGDRVSISRNAQMMIHEAHGVAIGPSADLRSYADLLDRGSDTIAATYAERAGGTVADWRARMRAETWFSAEEAVKAGLADEVAAPPAKEPRADQRWFAMFNYAGRAAAPPPILGQPTQPAEPEAVLDLSSLTDQFRSGMTAARTETPLPFDPAAFRDAIRAVSQDLALPTPPKAPEPVAPVEPEPTIHAYDFRSALRKARL